MSYFHMINVNGAGDGLGEGQNRLRDLGHSVMASMATVGDAADAVAQAVRNRQGTLNDEAASRGLLQTYLEDAGNATMLEATAPERPEAVPDMRLRGTTTTPDLAAHTVSFNQSAASIPIFGGRIVVDVGSTDKTLVAINGRVATVPRQSPVATLSPGEAQARLAAWGGVETETIAPANAPRLTWFMDEPRETWHLAYRFSQIPMTPPEDPTYDPATAPFAGDWACLGHSIDPLPPAFDYFVDANDGAVIYCFSSRPHFDVPSQMRGVDCDNVPRSFWGLSAGEKFVLVDPIRNIETYDFRLGDLSANPPVEFPKTPIDSMSQDLGDTAQAAVSAHYHAKIVFDFYNDVLKRNGIDDKGMKLISVVNVDYRFRNTSERPIWRNAVWSQGKMWYGQDVLPSSKGRPQSLARFLDVIGHELTHGVTETTSGLVYRDLPGALNESFSDIFGVLIANWFPNAPNPLIGWCWEIGAGLGRGGGPLRNFADPAAAGQPDHMRQYVPLPVQQDNGGVHIYSGIHNKAVHGLLTATDAAGDVAFPTTEVALLLYLTLTRLTPTSDFTAARRTLENVAGVYYGDNAERKAQRLAVIDAAYSAVGIV